MGPGAAWRTAALCRASPEGRGGGQLLCGILPPTMQCPLRAGGRAGQAIARVPRAGAPSDIGKGRLGGAHGAQKHSDVIGSGEGCTQPRGVTSGGATSTAAWRPASPRGQGKLPRGVPPAAWAASAPWKQQQHPARPHKLPFGKQPPSGSFSLGFGVQGNQRRFNLPAGRSGMQGCQEKGHFPNWFGQAPLCQSQCE